MNFINKSSGFFILVIMAMAIMIISTPVFGEERVRLAKPRLQPLTESEWDENQTKLLTPLKIQRTTASGPYFHRW